MRLGLESYCLKEQGIQVTLEYWGGTRQYFQSIDYTRYRMLEDISNFPNKEEESLQVDLDWDLGLEGFSIRTNLYNM